MRLAAAVLLTIPLLACSNQTASPPAPSPPPPAQSRAADLRTQLDLLLAEHVMIVAKESAAAVNHADEYAAYTSLLAANSADVGNLFGRAFGDTVAKQVTQPWNTQNDLLVDYAIGVVTHNDDKANGAMSGLSGTFAPQLALILAGLSNQPVDRFTQLLTEQAHLDRAFIDDVEAGNFSAYYADLHRAYAHTSSLGDVLAVQIAGRFPDKFPGDASTHRVDVRVSLNLLLQEHAYLSTMLTDSVVAGRSAEKDAAQTALGSNAAMLGAAEARLYDNGDTAQLDHLWAGRDKLIVDYASGADPTSDSLAHDFVSGFVYVTHVDRLHVLRQVEAMIKVIDDQRGKSSQAVATDDRAAATAMQPIADSIEG